CGGSFDKTHPYQGLHAFLYLITPTPAVIGYTRSSTVADNVSLASESSWHTSESAAPMMAQVSARWLHGSAACKSTRLRRGRSGSGMIATGVLVGCGVVEG
ncbi:hypothetical protein, partial [Streptosporangium album]|uniref:hypothetical protein n=1 Tax=Streptosporangium album TaxID=47479 RepID=UPI0031E56D6F